VYLFLAILLIFILINFLSAVYLNYYYLDQSNKNIFKLSILKKLIPNISADGIAEIQKIFNAKKTKYGRFRLTYAPLVEHRDSDFESYYLNVTNGFRSTNNLPPNNKQEIHAVFGGSTTFGTGVPDWMTIPSYIEDTIKLKDKNTSVINAASQSYFSTLEVISFQKMLNENRKFRSVIFIDGLNDVHQNIPKIRNETRYSHFIRKFWPEIDYIYNYDDDYRYLSHLTFLGKKFFIRIPITRFINLQVKRIKIKITSEKGERYKELWEEDINFKSIDFVSLAKQISDLTQTNWNIIRGICSYYKIKSYFVLQPVYYLDFPIEKHSFLPVNEDPFYKKIYNEYYNNMRAKNLNNHDFIDASSVFKEVNFCPFIDSHHYSPEGNKMIADFITKKMIT